MDATLAKMLMLLTCNYSSFKTNDKPLAHRTLMSKLCGEVQKRMRPSFLAGSTTVHHLLHVKLVGTAVNEEFKLGHHRADPKQLTVY